MTSRLLLTVGNGMMGDDGAGPLLAQKIQHQPLRGWEVLNGGSTPENVMHRARELSPYMALIVDAADMDLPPGEVRYIPMDKLDDPFLMTTHTLPLSYLIQALLEFVPKVQLLGIQTEITAFGYPMSFSVRQAVAEVYNKLADDDLDWENL